MSILYYSKKSLCLLIVIMLLIAAMVPIIAGEINKSGTYFWINPERNIVKPVGSNFQIQINIANAPTTYAWAAYLRFNASVLTATSVTEGNWFSLVSPKNFLLYGTGIGVLQVAQTFTNNTLSASGNGWLFNVTFHVSASGSTTLDLYDTSLVNPSGVRTYYPNNDGFFTTSTPAHDVAITGITANYTEVAENKTVKVTVTILDEGSNAETVDIKVYAERLTHNPANADEVWVGDLGAMDRASGDPNWRQNVEYLIGENTSVHVSAGGTNFSSFLWDTTNVAGETYTICANATILGASDSDLHDNVFIGPQVHVISTHDLKVSDVEILTPEVDKSNGVAGAQYTVVMNFTGLHGAPVTTIAPCNWYNATGMQQRVGYEEWAPLPCTWWEILVSASSDPYQWTSVNFHVDKSDPVTHTFHIDQVILANGIPGIPTGAPALWVVAKQVAKITATVKNEGTVAETATVKVFVEAPYEVLNFSNSGTGSPYLEPCFTGVINSYSVVPPLPGSWWQIVASPFNPDLVGKEFQVDAFYPGYPSTFHINFTWPDWGELVPALPGWVIAEREIVVGTLPVSLGDWTQANSTKTLYFHWNVDGNWTTNPDCPAPGYKYTIKAAVIPVSGEEMKNWKDNKFVGGTVEVVIYDVAVQSVEVLEKCNINGFYPVVRLKATLVNLGTKSMRVTVYFIAIDLATGVTIFCGETPGLSVTPPAYGGTPVSVDAMSPYVGWNTLLPSLMPPYPTPVPGHSYEIVALAFPSDPGRDDNPYDDANIVPSWTLPVVNHDVAAFSGWFGTGGDVRAMKGIEETIPEVYWRCPVLINVNVASYATNPLIAPSESANVSLFYRNSTATMTFMAWNGTSEVPITEIRNCTWFAVKLPSVKPEPCSWWHIFWPDVLYSIEFHVDQFSVHLPYYLFHVDRVMVSGNYTAVTVTPPVQNATAEIEVQIGTTQKVSGLYNMQLMTFFNVTGFPATAGTLNIVDIKPGNWYAYNMTLGGKIYGNLLTGPSANTWWELKFPQYDFMIHIDQVVSLGGTLGYKFHVDKVKYAWTNVDKNVTGPPYPAPLQIAWRIQPKTVTFALNTGPATPFNTPHAWYYLVMVAHITLVGATDQDPCDNKYVADPDFGIRDPWGDVDGNGKVQLADFGKLKLIYSEVYPYLNPPPYDTIHIYDVTRMDTYYRNKNPETGIVEHLMPDVTCDGLVKFSDIGTEKLIYSGFPPPPPSG